MGIFQDAQGQLTPQSLVESGPNSNLSEILWLPSLPVSMKKIRSKMKALACSQHFPHYNPMGAIRCHGHQSSDLIWSQIYCILSPYPMMLQKKNRCNGPTGLRDIHVRKCEHTDRHTDRRRLELTMSLRLRKKNNTHTRLGSMCNFIALI